LSVPRNITDAANGLDELSFANDNWFDGRDENVIGESIADFPFPTINGKPINYD
jgi:hypothetical protein